MPVERGFSARSALKEYAEEGKRVYLLIEGAGSDPVGKKHLLGRHPRTRFLNLYLGTEYQPLQDVGPLLVPPEETPDFLTWYIETGFSQKAGILLIGDADEQAILRHLQGIIEVGLPDYNFAFFRFYDPDALECYAMCVDEPERERLLGPLTAMLWPTLEIDDQGVEAWTWNEVFRPPDRAPYVAPQGEPAPIRLTEAQLDAFERYKEEKMANWLLKHKFRLLTP